MHPIQQQQQWPGHQLQAKQLHHNNDLNSRQQMQRLLQGLSQDDTTTRDVLTALEEELQWPQGKDTAPHILPAWTTPSERGSDYIAHMEIKPVREIAKAVSMGVGPDPLVGCGRCVALSMHLQTVVQALVRLCEHLYTWSNCLNRNDRLDLLSHNLENLSSVEQVDPRFHELCKRISSDIYGADAKPNQGSGGGKMWRWWDPNQQQKDSHHQPVQNTNGQSIQGDADEDDVEILRQQTQAAIKIQSRNRGKTARREVEAKRKQNAQSSGISYQASQKNEEEEIFREQTRAAMKIQSRHRGKTARREVEAKKMQNAQSSGSSYHASQKNERKNALHAARRKSMASSSSTMEPYELTVSMFPTSTLDGKYVRIAMRVNSRPVFEKSDGHIEKYFFVFLDDGAWGIKMNASGCSDDEVYLYAASLAQHPGLVNEVWERADNTGAFHHDSSVRVAASIAGSTPPLAGAHYHAPHNLPPLGLNVHSSPSHSAQAPMLREEPPEAVHVTAGSDVDGIYVIEEKRINDRPCYCKPMNQMDFRSGPFYLVFLDDWNWAIKGVLDGDPDDGLFAMCEDWAEHPGAVQQNWWTFSPALGDFEENPSVKVRVCQKKPQKKNCATRRPSHFFFADSALES